MTARRLPPKRRPAKSSKCASAGSQKIAIGALLAFAGLVVVLALFGGEGLGPETASTPASRVATAIPPQPVSRPGPAPSPPRAAAPAPEKHREAEPTRPADDAAGTQKPPPVSAAKPAQQVAALRPPAPERQPEQVKPAPVEGRPRIVIVIDDMGLDRRRSSRIVELPGPLTLAWLPYAKQLPVQTEAARKAGHELIVHVPMQPDGPSDPGPNALMTGLPEAEIRRRLGIGLSAFHGYVGINNHMGSRFTADAAGMNVVLDELAQRGLLFLDSRTTGASAVASIGSHHSLPLAARDVFLDHEQTPAFLAQALARTEAIARQNGVAIAIGHPHDVTAAALEAWLPTLEKKGFQLVPVSAVAKVQRPAS